MRTEWARRTRARTPCRIPATVLPARPLRAPEERAEQKLAQQLLAIGSAARHQPSLTLACPLRLVEENPSVTRAAAAARRAGSAAVAGLAGSPEGALIVSSFERTLWRTRNGSRLGSRPRVEQITSRLSARGSPLAAGATPPRAERLACMVSLLPRPRTCPQPRRCRPFGAGRASVTMVVSVAPLLPGVVAALTRIRRTGRAAVEASHPGSIARWRPPPARSRPSPRSTRIQARQPGDCRARRRTSAGSPLGGWSATSPSRRFAWARPSGSTRARQARGASGFGSTGRGGREVLASGRLPIVAVRARWLAGPRPA